MIGDMCGIGTGEHLSWPLWSGSWWRTAIGPGLEAGALACLSELDSGDSFLRAPDRARPARRAQRRPVAHLVCVGNGRVNLRE